MDNTDRADGKEPVFNSIRAIRVISGQSAVYFETVPQRREDSLASKVIRRIPNCNRRS